MQQPIKSHLLAIRSPSSGLCPQEHKLRAVSPGTSQEHPRMLSNSFDWELHAGQSARCAGAAHCGELVAPRLQWTTKVEGGLLAKTLYETFLGIHFLLAWILRRGNLSASITVALSPARGRADESARYSACRLADRYDRVSLHCQALLELLTGTGTRLHGRGRVSGAWPLGSQRGSLRVLPLKEVEISEVWISIFIPEEHFHVTATSKVHCRAEG